jgi:hypothetical protein
MDGMDPSPLASESSQLSNFANESFDGKLQTTKGHKVPHSYNICPKSRKKKTVLCIFMLSSFRQLWLWTPSAKGHIGKSVKPGSWFSQNKGQPRWAQLKGVTNTQLMVAEDNSRSLPVSDIWISGSWLSTCPDLLMLLNSSFEFFPPPGYL